MTFLHALDGEPLLQLGAILAVVVFVAGNITGFAIKYAAYRQHKRRR
jgi:uncharacterized membrane protein